MEPIPCANCGQNFMRRSPDPTAPKLCNTCENRGVKLMQVNQEEAPAQPSSEIKILIETDRRIQIEVEEYCINKGISFSDYFHYLHENLHVIEGGKAKAPALEGEIEISPDGKFAQLLDENDAPLGAWKVRVSEEMHFGPGPGDEEEQEEVKKKPVKRKAAKK